MRWILYCYQLLSFSCCCCCYIIRLYFHYYIFAALFIYYLFNMLILTFSLLDKKKKKLNMSNVVYNYDLNKPQICSGMAGGYGVRAYRRAGCSYRPVSLAGPSRRQLQRHRTFGGDGGHEQGRAVSEWGVLPYAGSHQKWRTKGWVRNERWWCMILVEMTIMTISSIIESPKGAINIQNNVPLRTRRALSLYNTRSIYKVAPFWFWKEHLWILIAPFWLSTETIWLFIIFTWLSDINLCSQCDNIAQERDSIQIYHSWDFERYKY